LVLFSLEVVISSYFLVCMNQNKGSAGALVILVVIAVVAIAGGAFYAGQNYRTPITPTQTVSDDDTESGATPQASQNTQVNTLGSNQMPPIANTTCLHITSPASGSTVSFPLTITGYVDLAGAIAGSCQPWAVFESHAGPVVVKDTNGNTRSIPVTVSTVGDYTPGMTQWPITATIPALTGTPYTNEIALHFASNEQRDGYSPLTYIFQTLSVTPYP
jgi:hypothetical protein